VLRALSALAVTTTTLSLAAAPAGSRPHLRVTPPKVAQGGVVAVWGSGCESKEPVTVLSPAFSPGASAAVGSLHTTARKNGTFALRAPIPKRKTRARYAVAVRCADRGLGALAWVRVV
jgi:hypothetical protein